MPRRSSNADRIARAAAEAEAKTKETVEKKASKAARPATPLALSAASKIKRMKIVWAVGKPGLEPVKTFPYLERAAADAESAKRGAEFRVVPLKVPME